MASMDDRVKTGSTKHRGKSQSPGADAQLGEVELVHNGLIDGRAGKDDIGAIGGQADNLFTSVQRKTPQPFDLPAQAFAPEPCGLHSLPVVGIKLSFDSAQNAGGSARADK